MAIKVAILTISDACSEGKRDDVSGQALKGNTPYGRKWRFVMDTTATLIVGEAR